MTLTSLPGRFHTGLPKVHNDTSATRIARVCGLVVKHEEMANAEHTRGARVEHAGERAGSSRARLPAAPATAGRSLERNRREPRYSRVDRVRGRVRQISTTITLSTVITHTTLRTPLLELETGNTSKDRLLKRGLIAFTILDVPNSRAERVIDARQASNAFGHNVRADRTKQCVAGCRRKDSAERLPRDSVQDPLG